VRAAFVICAGRDWTGLLAVPVLAGSAAYAIGEARNKGKLACTPGRN
jgi:hypothetical protein